MRWSAGDNDTWFKKCIVPGCNFFNFFPWLRLKNQNQNNLTEFWFLWIIFGKTGQVRHPFSTLSPSPKSLKTRSPFEWPPQLLPWLIIIFMIKLPMISRSSSVSFKNESVNSRELQIVKYTVSHLILWAGWPSYGGFLDTKNIEKNIY